ncbi:sigma-70 family RNA polymerase sigma factor [Calycomorphotria hydatis]|uniref:ECF RNA polymerase sigma-E factor n=1 Tax=Calycomorphotria hydatis TaxID=2528027 RepID=A0A517T3V6_9PLAN|nr:sigma-70 family RNA polymerase sigma factor [Calycomorphotria hydatis]QDT63057.1 ECF RNA polymerase sigma-E factor [Calycomorphotria hydatis]
MGQWLEHSVQDDSMQAHEQFVRELRANYWPVYRYVISLVPQPSEADDLMQEVSVVLWRKFDEFEQGTNFLAWAKKVALNTTRNYLKSRRRSRVVSSGTLNAIAQTERGMSEILELRRVFLAECIEELPLEKRRLIRQRYLEEHSPEELAAASQNKTANIYNQLSRIRKQLLDCITKKINRSSER